VSLGTPIGRSSRTVIGGQASRLPSRLAREKCAARAAGGAGGGARGSRRRPRAARGAAGGRPPALERPDLAACPAALRRDGAACGGGAAGRRGSAGGTVSKRRHAGAPWPGASGGRGQQRGGRAAAAGAARRCGAAGVGCDSRWVSLVCASLQCARVNKLVKCSGLINHETGQGRVRGCNRDCPGGAGARMPGHAWLPAGGVACASHHTSHAVVAMALMTARVLTAPAPAAAPRKQCADGSHKCCRARGC